MRNLVFVENSRPVTDSLNVAESFGKEHARVLRDIRSLGCSEEFRVGNFAESTYMNLQGRPTPKIVMSEQGFTMLVMSYTGQRAMEFKERYISEFHDMREKLSGPKLPQTKIEALEAYLLELKRSELLLTENKILEQRVKEYEPKISYFDTILQSKDTVTITQIAKDYGLSGQQLNKILHEEKVQYKLNEQWLLYRNHQDKGYTKSTTFDVHYTAGDITVKMNTRWTQKGRLFIHEILKTRGIVPYMDRANQATEAQ